MDSGTKPSMSLLTGMAIAAMGGMDIIPCPTSQPSSMTCKIPNTARNSPIPKQPTVRVGRNDLCPCGSGRKYKKCHLAVQLGTYQRDPDKLPRSKRAETPPEAAD